VQDTHISGQDAAFDIPSFKKDDKNRCFIATSTDTSVLVSDQQTVYLEDLDLIAETKEEIKTWISWIARQVFPSEETWQTMFTERVCIVHDDVFNFLINTATEIIARIKLKEETKTVKDGGLWYEEALPSETILSGVVLANPQNASRTTIEQVFNVLEGLVNKTIQIGGKATVGRGICRVQLTREEGQ
jgi:CRISPR-associated protein Cmr4